MKKLLLILLISLLPYFIYAQQTINSTLTHDGMEREYISYVPASYDADSPSALVLCFHGYTSSAKTIMNYSGFNKIADTANFIVVYPQGSLLEGTTHWNVGGWTLNSNTDDVGFTDALLDKVSKDYNIDSTKIYSTGMSNGGFMSFLLACQLSDRIAAIASVTGSMTPETYEACDPQHPTPVLQIHGTADGTVPYTGASWTKSIADVLDYWVEFNNSNTAANTSKIEDSNTSDGSTAEKIKYGAGDNCAVVTHYKVTGGDHTWPGAWGNMDINASAIVWDFFSQYDIKGKASCEEDNSDPITSVEDKKENKFKLYPNPTNSLLTIQLENTSNISYQVTSIEGKVVLNGQLKPDDRQIDISDLQAAVYLLKIGEQSVRFVKE